MTTKKEIWNHYEGKDRYKVFAALSACTITQALNQLDKDKGKIITQIILKNSLQCYHSIIDELHADFLVQFYLYHEKYGSEWTLGLYNRRNEFRGWAVALCRNRYNTHSSAFFREKNGSKSLNISYQEDIPEVKQEEEEQNPYLAFDKEEIKSTIISILFSPRAQEIFLKEEIDLFVSFYFIDGPKWQKWSINKLSDESRIGHNILVSIFANIRSFLREELKKR